MTHRVAVGSGCSVRFLIAAIPVPALEGGPSLAADFLDQKGGFAAWARLINWAVPDGEFTGRIICAGVERTPLSASLLGEVASVLGTFDAEGYGFRGLTGRIG